MKGKRHFFKTKKHSKTWLDKNNLPFYDAPHHFVFLYFSNARQAVFAPHTIKIWQW